MLYAMAQKKGSWEQVQILSGNHELPVGTIIHSASRFWPGYQKWIEEGNTPIPIQPSSHHFLNENNEWILDLEHWLDTEVRPGRDLRMDDIDRRISRYERAIRLGATPVDSLDELDSINQQLADLPGTLTEIVDPVPWPTEPDK